MRKLIKSWTKKDFKIDWFSGTGAGGQHRNKHQNCCRVTHIESNITTTGQNHKSRQQNFKEAFEEMGVRLKNHYYTKAKKDRVQTAQEVRVYNECENRVKDHLTGEKTSIDDFNLDNIIADRVSLNRD